MVIDSSAVLAILQNEPERHAFNGGFGLLVPQLLQALNRH